MKIGCGEWGFRDLPMEEHFGICRTFGFKTMEFGIGGGRTGRLAEELTDAGIASFLAMGKRYGIRTPFCCIENDFTLPPAQHAAMLARTLASIRLAARLGASHVRLFAGFTPASQMTEPLWRQMIAAFAAADAVCKPLGLLISIETHGRITMHDGAACHEHTVTTDRTALSRLVKELPIRVGFNYDPGNIKAAAPDDRRLCLDLINDRINYCHLKDWRRKGLGWEALAVGDDDLDYAPLLKQMKFDGVYLIEYEPTADVEDGIGRSLAYLAKISPGYVLA